MGLFGSKTPLNYKQDFASLMQKLKLVSDADLVGFSERQYRYYTGLNKPTQATRKRLYVEYRRYKFEDAHILEELL